MSLYIGQSWKGVLCCCLLLVFVECCEFRTPHLFLLVAVRKASAGRAGTRHPVNASRLPGSVVSSNEMRSSFSVSCLR